MIRELLRYGFYKVPDQNLMTPYCWASTGRVRNLLTRLGADIEERADMDASPAIYEFVVENIGPDHARFDGDLDLPCSRYPCDALVKPANMLCRRWLRAAGF